MPLKIDLGESVWGEDQPCLPRAGFQPQLISSMVTIIPEQEKDAQAIIHFYNFGAEWKKKSVRYYWLHLPSRIVSHARYTIAKVAITLAIFEELVRVYLQLCLVAAPG